MSFEQPEEPSQEQLVQEYLSGYEEYKKISAMATNHLRVLDKLREEAIAPQSMLDEQEALFKSTHKEAQEVMERYNAIWPKLTPETRDKYLKIETSVPVKGE